MSTGLTNRVAGVIKRSPATSVSAAATTSDETPPSAAYLPPGYTIIGALSAFSWIYISLVALSSHPVAAINQVWYIVPCRVWLRELPVDTTRDREARQDHEPEPAPEPALALALALSQLWFRP